VGWRGRPGGAGRDGARRRSWGRARPGPGGTTPGRRGAARLVTVLGAAVLPGVLLAACTNAPPPPLVPASATTTTTPVTPDTSQLVVGVDGISGGYNPHVLADQSSVTTALSALLLPSVFRTGPDGTPVLDRNLMTSAAVTSANPFTVTYSLRTDATWSDGTPVDAADFVYLRTQLSTQPGVIDPAGYRLISNIAARDNGKTIQVVFAKPYPGWRSLFSDLLPGHLLKDAPGGWAGALADGFPATAGPFDIKSLDSGGGQIVLERSDRYWGKPTTLGQVVLRQFGQRGQSDAKGLAANLRSGADQAAFTRADAAGLATLQQSGSAVSVTAVPRPEVATLLLRPGTPQLADPAVRAAVAAAIDRPALIQAGTGGGPSAQLVANALVTAPSLPGYAATMPPAGPPGAPNPAAVTQALTQAGYTKPAGTWVKDGKPLTLVVAAPADREPYVTLAKLVAQQLTAAGFLTTLETPAAAQLYGEEGAGAAPSPTTAPTTTGAAGTSTDNPAPPGQQPVNVLVGPRPVGGDPASELAAEFGCPATLPGSETVAPPNPLGFCDRTLQPDIDAALTGEMSISDAIAKVEPALWAQNVEIPLFQISDVLAVGGQAVGVAPGPPLAGPFSGAPDWNRSTG
jgi:ABC-type transport system substrate-binding protein